MIGEAARDARGRPAWSGRPPRAFWRREIEMERVSESESEYVPRRRRMARMDGGEMRMRIEGLICLGLRSRIVQDGAGRRIDRGWRGPTKLESRADNVRVRL